MDSRNANCQSTFTGCRAATPGAMDECAQHPPMIDDSGGDRLTVLVHLSDLHMGAEIPAVVDALVDRVNSINPDAVLVSGDLTQRARAKQFRAAKALLSRLEAPTHVVPGNHDIPLLNPLARAFWPFRRYEQEFLRSWVDAVQVRNVRILRLNSVRPERHARGRVTSLQRRAALLMMSDVPDDHLLLVLLHHPPVVKQAEATVASLINGDQIMNEWCDARVHLVLSGHIHEQFLLPCRSAGKHVTWVLNAGTATSSRLRRGYPNSFNTIRIRTDETLTDSRNVDIERYDYRPDDNCFALASQRQIRADSLIRER